MRRRPVSKFLSGVCSAAFVLLFASPAHATTKVTWHMDDATGASDPGGHTLSLTNIDTNSAYWTFSGNGLATTASDDNTFDPAKASFSVSVMVRSSTMPSTSVGDYDLVRKGLSSTSGGYWKLELIPNKARTRTLVFCQMSGGYLKWAPFNLTDGKWHTVTCTRDANAKTVAITVDGRSNAKALTSLKSISNSSKLFVGAKDRNADGYVGDMDELSISVG